MTTHNEELDLKDLVKTVTASILSVADAVTTSATARAEGVSEPAKKDRRQTRKDRREW